MMPRSLLRKLCFQTSNSNDNASPAPQWDPTAVASDSADSHSLPLPIGEYEVFLNFRGPDTRHQIAGILYWLLVNLKVRTFKDDNELRKGEETWPNLDKAIEQSKICVPIFSENYADSKWCLKELAAIVDRQEQDQGCVILPIFYMVDPGDVRHQSGPFKKAFRKHKRNVNEKTIQVWKDALRKVGALNGWHVKSVNEQVDIAKLVTDVVWKHLSKNSYALEIGKLVGIHNHVEAVQGRMSLNSVGASIVGIHGMGGIGKTTIAKAVYNKEFAQFDRCSFVENVRSLLHQNNGVINLQKQIISNILRSNSIESISNASEGIGIIRDRVSRFKSLIVLDDVDEEFKFVEVLGNINYFVSGSIFIITSRNVRVLRTLTEECKLYKVREMSPRHALQLFCMHAFREDSPPPSFKTLSEDIVSVVAGLPLTLKVVGSSLFEEEEVIWRDKLSRLKEIPEEEVVERLKMSYDILNHEAKQIFLDIACFFIGEDKEMPSYMWSDCGFFPVTSINILIQRSMIEIASNGLFRMHDQLRDMGREIVRRENIEQPWERSRIWSREDALGMLCIKKGAEVVKCIQMNSSSSDGVLEDLVKECFMNLSELRYFDVIVETITSDFSNHLPNLRWLRLEIGNGASMPNFCVENLVILELLSSVNDDWGSLRHIKMANKLKVLKLSGEFLVKYPDFPRSGSLETLHLQNFGPRLSCNYLDIGNLRNLKELHLWYCQVGEIRGGTFGKMKELRELNIIDLWFESNLGEALADIGDLQFLEILIVHPTDNNVGPRSVHANILLGAKLPTTLKVLATPSPVANLPELLKLEKLTVDGCGIEIPPADSSNMWWKKSKLESLTLENAMMIPTNTSSPSFLRLLPSALTTLIIMKCPEMKWLPNLKYVENLTYLSINGCRFLKEIPGLGGLKSLETLSISGLEAVRTLDGLDSLYSLTSFKLEGCHALERLPSLASLSKLLALDISSCCQLTGIEGLEGLKSLQTLEIVSLGGLSRLTRLLGFGSLLSYNKLETLTILNCSLLRSLPFHDLDDEREAVVVYSLRKLNICGYMPLLQIFCWMIQQSMFPSLTELTLNALGFYYGHTKVMLDGLVSMDELVELSLHGLVSMWRLPSLSKLQNLKNLMVTRAPNLLGIEGLAGLKSLERLDLSGCTSLQRLPVDELYGLEQLKSVDISGCTNLIGRSTLYTLEPNVEILWHQDLDDSDISWPLEVRL